MMIKLQLSEVLVLIRRVEAKLIDNVKDRTVLIFQKEEENIHGKNGHRQRHSKIQITNFI